MTGHKAHNMLLNDRFRTELSDIRGSGQCSVHVRRVWRATNSAGAIGWMCAQCGVGCAKGWTGVWSEWETQDEGECGLDAEAFVQSVCGEHDGDADPAGVDDARDEHGPVRHEAE